MTKTEAEARAHLLECHAVADEACIEDYASAIRVPLEERIRELERANDEWFEMHQGRTLERNKALDHVQELEAALKTERALTQLTRSKCPACESLHYLHQGESTTVTDARAEAERRCSICGVMWEPTEARVKELEAVLRDIASWDRPEWEAADYEGAFWAIMAIVDGVIAESPQGGDE